MVSGEQYPLEDRGASECFPEFQQVAAGLRPVPKRSAFVGSSHLLSPLRSPQFPEGLRRMEPAPGDGLRQPLDNPSALPKKEMAHDRLRLARCNAKDVIMATIRSASQGAGSRITAGMRPIVPESCLALDTPSNDGIWNGRLRPDRQAISSESLSRGRFRRRGWRRNIDSPSHTTII